MKYWMPYVTSTKTKQKMTSTSWKLDLIISGGFKLTDDPDEIKIGNKIMEMLNDKESKNERH